MPKGGSNKKRKDHFSASGTFKAQAADPVKGPAPTKQDPAKRSAATVEKATGSVPAAPAPRTPVPPTSLTSGEEVPSSISAVPYPDVSSLTVDSTSAAVFPSPHMFDITNNDDDLPGSLKTIWEYSHCEICSKNDNQGWKCLWCSHFQKERHHTRSVSHFSEQK